MTTLYVLHDLRERVLYVGVSEVTWGRMAQHAASKAWWGNVAGARFSHYATRAEAEEAERCLIQTLRPPHNTACQPVSPTITDANPTQLVYRQPSARRLDYRGPSGDNAILGPWLHESAPCTPTKQACQAHGWPNDCQPIRLGDDDIPISLGHT